MAGSAAAQSRIGTAVRVINKVTADQSLIKTGDGVAQNQTVEVATDLLGELKLDDDTKLALGPGAKLLLDKFVYDPAKSSGAVTVNLVKGAFRFVTGAAQKKDYKINTPNASIAVRGTVFDIYIAPNGTEWILLHQGSIEVCNASNVCRQLSSPCQALGVPPAGQIGEPGGLVTRTGSSDIDFDVAFPFVRTPPLVDFRFYHTRAQIELNQCPDPNAPIKTERADNGSTPSAPAAAAASAAPGGTGYSPPPSPPSAPVKPQPVDLGDDAAPQPSDDETTNIPPPTIPVDDIPSTPPAGVSVYVGLQGGRGFQDNQETEITCSSDFTDPNDCDGGSFPATVTQIYEFDTRGLMAGGYAGVDFRAGPFLFGAEADFSYSDVDSSAPLNANGVEFPIGSADISQDIKWMSTVRARAGIGFGNVLVFATGGVAFADIDYNYDFLPSPGENLAATASEGGIKTGWTAGGGFEINFGLWTLRSEYLHYDFGRETLNSDVLFNGVIDTDIDMKTDFETKGHIVRTGVSFRLN